MFWKSDADDYSTGYVDSVMGAASHRSKALGYGLAALVSATALGTSWLGPASAKLSENLCAAGAVADTHIAVLVDKSDDMSDMQQAALESSLRAHQRHMKLGDRMTVFLMTPNEKAPVQVLYDRCRPKTREEADPLKENPKQIAKTYATKFVAPLEEVLMALGTSHASDSSPILEALHAMGASAPLSEPAKHRKWELWSDMLANSTVISHFQQSYSFEDLVRVNSLYINVPALRENNVQVYQLANRYDKYHSAAHAHFWASYFEWGGVAGSALSVQRL